MSDDVARELVHRADRGELDLGGELLEVSVLFGDIRGFTSISQGMDPRELVAMLNRRFEVIVESVAEYDGILNKFVGDAIMAIWNAPRAQAQHAVLACRAALEIQERLAAIDVEDEGPEIRFGLGINTGLALAGNVGAGQRLEYTVIGEAVNTASRLCGAAEGGAVWIGERTLEATAGAFDVERLPPQNLKNMAEPVTAYRLIGEAPPGGSARRADRGAGDMSIPIPAILVALGVTGAAAAAAMAGFLLLSGGSAQASSTVLTVLSGTVQVEEAGSGSLRDAVDGEVLEEGDRVVTGEDARASITFFEGSTQVLEPGTDVTIEAVGSTSGGGLLADVSQAAGTTWNTVLDSSERRVRCTGRGARCSRGRSRHDV